MPKGIYKHKPISKSAKAKMSRTNMNRKLLDDHVMDKRNGLIVKLRKEKSTLQEIADITGLTRERIRQIVNSLAK